MEVNDTQQMRIQRLTPLLYGMAAFFFLLEWIPPILGKYRYFIDEFYYLACADHLSLGYVDHPPLSIFVLWIVRGMLGDSLLAIRLLPALAGGLSVLLVGNIARRLGANSLGQLLAGGAIVIGSVYQIMFSYYSMNAISILLWAVGFSILVKLEQKSSSRWWLALGIVVGLGLLNKHTFILFPIALSVGLLLTHARHHLKNRWLWLGSLIALLIVAPNLIWQMTHGWPSIEFYRNAEIYKNVATPPLQILLYQIFATNPGTLAVWIIGLVFLLMRRQGKPMRHLGWMYIVLLLLMMISGSSRPDRIAGAYIILFAAGGAFIPVLCHRRRFGWIKSAIPSAYVILGLALVPLGLPLLPVDLTATYAARAGVVPQIEQSEGEKPQLPLWLGYRIGWEQFVDDIEAAADEIDPKERGRAFILVPTYGQAGAIELLGRGRHLPPVYATQNSYFHWGIPPDSDDVAIITGFSEENIRRIYADAEVVRVYRCDHCIGWRDNEPIWIARTPKVKMSLIWPLLKHYE